MKITITTGESSPAEVRSVWLEFAGRWRHSSVNLIEKDLLFSLMRIQGASSLKRSFSHSVVTYFTL